MSGELGVPTRAQGSLRAVSNPSGKVTPFTVPEKGYGKRGTHFK